MKRFLNSYWLKSGVLTILERFSVVFFGFLVFIILANTLDLVVFGVFTLFQTVTSVFEIVRQGLVRNPLIKFFNSDPEEKELVLSNSLYLNLMVSLFYVIVLLFGSSLIQEYLNAPGLSMMLQIYAITNLFMLFNSHFDFVQQANLSFKGGLVGTLVRRGIFLILIVLFYIVKNGIELVDLSIFEMNDIESNSPNKVSGIELFDLAIIELVSVIVSGIAAFVASSQFTYFRFKYSEVWIKKLFNYGKYTFGTNIGTTIFKNIDQFMLTRMISPEAVAFYNPALRISNLVEVPTMAVSSIVFPQVSKKILTEGKEGAKVMYEKSVGTIMAFMIPTTIFTMIFARELILYTAGNRFLETIGILQVTILYTFFVPFNRQFGVILDAFGKPKLNFYIIILNSIINIISNYIFIKNFGLIGAAYGTLTTLVCAFFIMQSILNKVLNVKTINVFRYTLGLYIKGCSKVFHFALKKV